MGARCCLQIKFRLLRKNINCFMTLIMHRALLLIPPQQESLQSQKNLFPGQLDFFSFFSLCLVLVYYPELYCARFLNA